MNKYSFSYEIKETYTHIRVAASGKVHPAPILTEICAKLTRNLVVFFLIKLSLLIALIVSTVDKLNWNEFLATNSIINHN